MSDTTSDPGSARPVRTRARLVRGGLVMTMVSVANRLSSLVAQLFLGAILFEEDFGLFATALGLTSLGAAVRSALQPVLIHHLEHDPAAYNRTYRTTMCSLWLLVAVAVASSGLIEEWLRAPGLQLLLVILLLLIPFQVLAGFGMARLNHSLEFGSVGKTLTFVTFGRHIFTVGCAFAGLGSLSFALGAVVAIAMELAILSRYTSLTVRPGLFSTQTVTDVWGAIGRLRRAVDRRWIWLSAIALTMANNGDYTAASIWESKETVGVYYFAFGLTTAFQLPLTLAVNTVLVPAFVGLKTKIERHDRTLETVGTFAVLGVLLFNSVLVVIVPVTHILWGGKWDESFPALLALTVFAPLQFIHPVSHAIQRGTGAWNLYLADIAAYGILTIIAASVGAYYGGLTTIVLLVVAANIIVTFAGLFRLSRLFGIKPSEMARVSILPWILGLVGVAAAHLIHPLDDPAVMGSLLRLPVFLALTLALVVYPYRRPLLEIGKPILARRS